MNLNLAATTFPSVKLFILFWLQDTVNRVAHQPKIIPFLPAADQKRIISLQTDLRTLNLQKKCSQINEKLVTKGIFSTNKVNNDTVVVYICAIALKLSPSWGTSAIDIATQIAEQFLYLSSQELSDDPKKYFTLKVIPPGWLHLQVTDLGIATWLQSLAEQRGGGDGGMGRRGDGEMGRWGDGENNSITPPIPLPPHLPISSSQSLLPLQYAHARCCSLLRLAQGEGKWGAIAPDAIPWLNEKGQLRLTHPAERRLISQLFSALDTMYCPASSKKLNWEKLAQEISFSWENFYRQCRIWGEVKTEVPELAQARLGLLMATQTILQLLLEDYLGVPAPLEL